MHRRVPPDVAESLGRIGRRGLAMLPPHVQAAVEASLRTERGVQPEPGQVATAFDPPYVFVVRAGHSPTFTSLRRLSWVRPDLVGVVFDRRWMGQRRVRNEPFSTERRRAERRRAEPNWTRAGFVLTAPPSVAPSRLPPVEAPAPAVSSPEVATSSMSSAPEQASHGLSRRWRLVALGVGVGLLLAVASAAGVYVRWLSDRVEGIDGTISGSPPAPPSTRPAARVRVEPSPARGTPPPATARFEPGSTAPRPSAATLIPAAPGPTPGSSKATARSTADSGGVGVDRCVTPAERMLAMRGGEVLGELVNAKLDTNAQPPRCLFVVERRDGTLWIVDSSRVEVRRQ